MVGFVRHSVLMVGESAAVPSVEYVAGYARVVVALVLRVRYPELSSSKAESFRIHRSVSVNCAPYWLQAPRASTRGASVIYGVGSGISGSWARELGSHLGDAAHRLEWTFALNLLARDPKLRDTKIGRTTLVAWLDGIAGYGCWLQTNDFDSPARRLYESLGFTALGHGPNAPNGRPGLVMFRPPHP